MWALDSMLSWGLLEVVKQGKVFVLYSFRCVFTCVYSRLLFIKISSPFSIMSISVSHYSQSLPPLPPSLPPSLPFCLFLPLFHFFFFLSLLDILAGRKGKKGISGCILINGKRQPDNFKCASGYVVQVGNDKYCS